MRYLWFVLIFYSCIQNGNVKEPINELPAPKETDYYTEVFKNNDQTFGYNIFRNTVLIIKQKTIPAKSGISGFNDSNKATLVAEFTLSKIKAGIRPPSLEEKEIDSILNIKNDYEKN